MNEIEFSRVFFFRKRRDKLLVCARLALTTMTSANMKAALIRTSSTGSNNGSSSRINSNENSSSNINGNSQSNGGTINGRVQGKARRKWPRCTSLQMATGVVAVLLLARSFFKLQPDLTDIRGNNVVVVAGNGTDGVWRDGYGNTGRVLVVYSGPTDLGEENSHPYAKPGKNQLYLRNFDYFLEHGIDCKAQDTALVITNTVQPMYEERIANLDKACRKDGHRVYMVIRENKCLDLESPRVVLFESEVNRSIYDYFFFANCGVTGPSRKWLHKPWVRSFTSLLNDEIRMSGLSHNCQGGPHIQSMLYCLDKVGMDIVLEKEAIFDCRPAIKGNTLHDIKAIHGLLIGRYEKGMSNHILSAGYGIKPFLRQTAFFDHNRTNCTEKDLWMTTTLNATYGRIPWLVETMFQKTSRHLSPGVAKEIGYTGKIKWNW